MPPHRVHLIVQYSQPARPPMTRSTARPAWHCGQLDSTGPACGEVCSVSNSDIDALPFCSLVGEQQLGVDVRIGASKKM
jgi:hypothetical protein